MQHTMESNIFSTPFRFLSSVVQQQAVLPGWPSSKAPAAAARRRQSQWRRQPVGDNSSEQEESPTTSDAPVHPAAAAVRM